MFLWISSSVAYAETVEDGLEAARRGDYETAISIIRPAAEAGDAVAQNAMGVFYGNGQGVGLDYSEAFRWYELSASQGYPSALHNLGIYYAEGWGVEKDPVSAYQLFLMAAEQGRTESEEYARQTANYLRKHFTGVYKQFCMDYPGKGLEEVRALGGDGDLQPYCQCLAERQTAAIELFGFQVGTIAHYQRLAFHDQCMSRTFPGRFRSAASDDLEQYYPKDAPKILSQFGFTTRPEPILSFDASGEDPETQLIVVDASSDLFCWSEPFEAGVGLFIASPDISITVPLLCDSGEKGYGGVFKYSEGQYVVGFALDSGLMDWTVHSM